MQRAQIGAAALAAALFAAPAAADWLVTRDGGRVETRGAWKTKGKLVVFTRADGQLSSLRLTDVDLAASERATAEAVAKAKEAAEVKPPPPPEKKEARWVMTDKDFRSTPPPPPKDEAKPEETDAAGRPKLNVVLESWERKNIPDGLEITGTLRNPGDEITADVGVTVRLFDETGALIATGEGRIATPALGPGEAANFRAAFTGVFTYAEAKFDTRGYGLRIRATKPEEAEAVKAQEAAPPAQ
jgi:hypothetical protein